MRLSIVFIFLFSLNSIAGDFNVMLGRPATFAIGALITATQKEVKDIIKELKISPWYAALYGKIAEKKRSVIELISALIAARDHLLETELVDELEAELAARGEENYNIEIPENLVQEKERIEIDTQKKPKQTFFVPGIRMATKESGSSSESGHSSDQENGSGQNPPGATDSEEDFLVTRRLRNLPTNSPVKGKKPTPFAFTAADFRTPGATPCGTPRVPTARPVHERIQQALRNLPAICKNMQIMKRRGITGKVLESAQWAEACASNHPYVGDNDGARTLREWKASQELLSFEKASNRLSSITYLAPEERDDYRVRIERRPGQNARLLLNGEPLNGYGLIFVMDPYGALYASRHVLGEFHHSSFLAGAAVLWAGEICTNQKGEIVFLSDKSGHYKPGQEQALNGLADLERQGVDLSQVILERTEGFFEETYNAKEYLDSNRSSR